MSLLRCSNPQIASALHDAVRLSGYHAGPEPHGRCEVEEPQEDGRCWEDYFRLKFRLSSVFNCYPVDADLE
jgi:hypothetical protein